MSGKSSDATAAPDEENAVWGNADTGGVCARFVHVHPCQSVCGGRIVT